MTLHLKRAACGQRTKAAAKTSAGWKNALQAAKFALCLMLLAALSGCSGKTPQVFVQGNPKIALSPFSATTLSFSVEIGAPENSEKVVVAVWSAAADDHEDAQDDLRWYHAKRANGAWRAAIKLDPSTYSAGYYFVHVYVDDAFYWNAFLITPEAES